MIELSRFVSPLGEISVAERKGKLLCITFGNLERLVREHPEVMQLGDSAVETAKAPGAASLERYLSGATDDLKAPVDLSLVRSEFDKKVLTRLLGLKRGRTVSYDELGQQAGHERAARAVGGSMRRNPLPVVVPCHRVLPKSGGLGSYTGGVDKKAWLLKREGVILPR